MVERIGLTMLMLILLYLVLTNGSAFNSILNSVGNLYNSQIKVLQGR